MANATMTRRAIAAGLKELMETRSFESLSVGDIARQCGVSRNTFYYHFRDKYDLISWVFHTEITPIVGDPTERGDWAQGLLALCSYMQANKKFYLNVLQFHGQNSFSDCLMEFYQERIARVICGQTTDEASASARLIARFYAHALVGVLLDWASAGMQQDPRPFVKMLDELLSGRATALELSARPFPEGESTGTLC